jgi:5-methylcytosine-specific restriction enzyme A
MGQTDEAEMSDPHSQIGKWYRSSRWARRSKLQLKQFPLCAMCLEKGIVTPATVADHVQAHKGNSQLFWCGELSSLCKPHHDGTKQVIDKRGYSDEVGADGWFVDPRHPSNGVGGTK